MTTPDEPTRSRKKRESGRCHQCGGPLAEIVIEQGGVEVDRRTASYCATCLLRNRERMRNA